MKKLTGAMLAAVILITSVGGVEAAVQKNTVENIIGWESSYWQKDTSTSGLTGGGTGVEVTNDPEILKRGLGTLHIWVEKSASNLKSCAVQQIDELEDGEEYRLTGDLYFSSGTSATYGFGLYMGEERIARLNQFATANQWNEIDYIFEYDYQTYESKKFTISAAMKGNVYADDLSLKKVVRDENGNILGYGEELLKNGNFEKDFVQADDVTSLKKEEYSGTVILSWQNPTNDNFEYCVILQDGQEIARTSKDVSTYEVKNLDNGQRHEFTVKTANRIGILSAGVSISAVAHIPYQRPDVIKDDYDNRIIGITEEMEYSINSMGHWQRYDSQNPPELDGSLTVYVRMYSDIQGIETPVQALYFTENSQGNDKINIQEIKVIENKLTIKGELYSKTKEDISFLVVRKGADRREYDSVLAIGQVKSDDKGEFFIERNISDKRKGIECDGDYIVYIDGVEGTNFVYDCISFVSTQNRKDAIEALLLAENPGTELVGSNRKAYEAIGIDVSDYINYSTDRTADVFKGTIEGLSAEDEDIAATVSKAFAKSLLITSVRETTEEEIYLLLKKYNTVLSLVYNGETCQQIIEKAGPEITAVCRYLKGKDCSSEEAFEKEYKSGLALYNINSATYGEISSLIKNNAQILGLATDQYSKYINLSGETKINADKAMVQYKNKTPFTSGTDILTAISNIISNLQGAGTGNSGGGGSGGGSGVSTESEKINPEPTKPYSSSEIVVDYDLIRTDTFNDLDSVKWAEESIMTLYNKNIVSGYGNGIFAPKKNITREEYAKMLVCIMGVEDVSAKCDFVDVEEGMWCYHYIASAFNNEIAMGTSKYEFGIGRNITREDLAVMTYRCLRLLGMEFANTEVDFIDNADISLYAKEAVGALQSSGIISGYEDGSFRPKNVTTRAEACRISSFLLDAREEG